LCFFLFFGITKAIAQKVFNAFFEPEIELGYKVTDNYSHSFAFENRNKFYENGDSEYKILYIEFAHFSEYIFSEDYSIGLGIQYRFAENFKASEENELRFQQQFELSPKNNGSALKHRFRNEQRFYKSKIKYRLRYRLNANFDIGESFGTSTYIGADTEMLFELAQTQKPELEQRFSTVIGWVITPNTQLELGTQYRLADYTKELKHELFLVMGFEFKL